MIKNLNGQLAIENNRENSWTLNNGIQNFLYKLEETKPTTIANEIKAMKTLVEGNILHGDPFFAYLIVDDMNEPAPLLIKRNVTKRILILSSVALCFYYRKLLFAMSKLLVGSIKHQLGYS